MSRYTEYLVRLQDGDGQPLTSFNCWGMKEVRETIATAREDWSHYETLRFLVTNEEGEVVLDKTHKSKVSK